MVHPSAREASDCDLAAPATVLVTGTDPRGVARASRALGSPALRGAYAAAIAADGVLRLPLPAD